MAPRATQAQLRQMARIALSRGLPEEDAEDVVVAAWQKAVAAYQPERGSFDALLSRVVQREAVEWWRRAKRRPEVGEAHLTLVVAPEPADLEHVALNQRRLLAALTEEERQLFTTWALQKQVPDLDAPAAGARLGLSTAEFNNGKRRLKAKILKLAADWELPPRAFFSVREDEGPRKGVRHVG